RVTFSHVSLSFVVFRLRRPPWSSLFPYTTLFRSRVTVTTAYERLVAEGFLEARVGAGTFVSAVIGDLQAARAPAGSGRHIRPVWRQTLFVAPASPIRHDFRLGMGDPAFFPRDEWRRAVNTRLATHDFALLLLRPRGPAFAAGRHRPPRRRVPCGPLRPRRRDRHPRRPAGLRPDRSRRDRAGSRGGRGGSRLSPRPPSVRVVGRGRGPSAGRR